MPRKTFKAAEPQHSPAESYISGEQPKELKTRRAQFVLKPSIVTDLKKIAAVTRRSMNETSLKAALAMAVRPSGAIFRIGFPSNSPVDT